VTEVLTVARRAGVPGDSRAGPPGAFPLGQALAVAGREGRAEAAAGPARAQRLAETAIEVTKASNLRDLICVILIPARDERLPGISSLPLAWQHHWLVLKPS
jgi:hypothetical protein